MPKKLFVAFALACVFAIPAQAGGWLTVHRYVHKTGRCGASNEVLASFYGTGRITANGERFNPYAVTAASYDYPLGTTITVTNPNNGRTCQVRVNDHGPNGIARVMGARIDFSLGSRDCLGMVQSTYVCAPYPQVYESAKLHTKEPGQHAHVRLASVKKAEPTKPAAAKAPQRAELASADPTTTGLIAKPTHAETTSAKPVHAERAAGKESKHGKTAAKDKSAHTEHAAKNEPKHQKVASKEQAAQTDAKKGAAHAKSEAKPSKHTKHGPTKHAAHGKPDTKKRPTGGEKVSAVSAPKGQ